jgi:hypothetical protein
MPTSSHSGRRNQNTNNNSRVTTTRRPRQIRNVQPSDIICTRASRAVENHPGTLLYNTVIDDYAPQYSSCRNANEKKQLTKLVIDTLQNEHGSRFIEPATSTDDDRGQQPYYYKLPLHKIHGKVSHALRTRCKSIGESSGQQQQQQRQGHNVDDHLPRALTASRTSTIQAGGATATGPLYATGFSNMPYNWSQLLASSSRNFNDNVNNNNNNITTIQQHASLLPDNNADTNLSDIDDASYTTHQFENDVRYIAVVRVSRSYVLSSSTSNNINNLPRDRPDQMISDCNNNTNTHHRTSRIHDQRSHQSSSLPIPLTLPFVQEEEDEDFIEFHYQNPSPQRERFLSRRREKIKRQKQFEYKKVALKKQKEMDRQKVKRRNRYFYHRRQKLKKEKYERAVYVL